MSSKYIIRQSLAWVLIVAAIIAGVIYLPAAIASIRSGNECLEAFQISENYAMEGKLYSNLGGTWEEVCMVGDPSRPTEREMTP